MCRWPFITSFQCIFAIDMQLASDIGAIVKSKASRAFI